MAIPVRDVLNRRNDLSTFVVHLTRDGGQEGDMAKDRLRSIIESRTIEARTAMGWADAQDDPADPSKQTQRVVSFSETPLEHIYSLTADIANRQVNLKPYGVALTKLNARRLGVNPVWYVDMTPGQADQWEVARALDALRDAAVEDGNFHDQEIAKVLPFCESMGTWPESQKEFWWEREWRKRGDFRLPAWSTPGCLVLCPEDELAEFEELVWRHEGAKPENRLRQCVDPRWGLEQIVAHLAGIPSDQVTPFGA